MVHKIWTFCNLDFVTRILVETCSETRRDTYSMEVPSEEQDEYESEIGSDSESEGSIRGSSESSNDERGFEDGWSGWRIVEEDCVDDVQIKFDAIQNAALEVAGEEVPVLLSRVRKAVNVREQAQLRIEHVLNYWIYPFAAHMKKYVNIVLARGEKHPKSTKQIYDFLQTELAVLVYQKAPTVLFDKEKIGRASCRERV